MDSGLSQDTPIYGHEIIGKTIGSPLKFCWIETWKMGWNMKHGITDIS